MKNDLFLQKLDIKVYNISKNQDCGVSPKRLHLGVYDGPQKVSILDQKNLRRRTALDVSSFAIAALICNPLILLFNDVLDSMEYLRLNFRSKDFFILAAQHLERRLLYKRKTCRSSLKSKDSLYLFI
ncbi:hypothetical protein H5410_050298 [Solanum commersonii]|uniref:Uncharacterized protein n=1 Tax=Solanum commersonii TaxID=4109 RepID=A0A9J5WWE2_SOLCO|nr:hypothetical protein H5410_050298 [Solanum commersonii]